MTDVPGNDRGETLRMSSDARFTMTPQLAVGLFITIAGVLLMLDRLHLFDVGGVFRLWPAAVVAIGGSMVLRKDDAKARFWGWALVILGVWLLLNTLGLVRIGFWELFWPLALVALGVRLVTHAMRYDFRSGEPASAGRTSLFAIMGESKRSNTDKPFRGGQMTALMGGCQLDLRQATIAPGQMAAIDVLAVMGGLEIWVPGGWDVVSQVVPIMGGVEDKRLPQVPVGVDASGAAAEAPPRLVLRGSVVMGGLTIKN